MNENIKELIESLPNEGVDCKGKEWVRYKPTSSRFIDRTGEVYGRLTALFPIREKGKIITKWLCQCSCGSLTIVIGNDLANGHIKSCGCSKQIENNISDALETGIDCKGRKWTKINLYYRMKDLTNKTFTRLTVLFPVKIDNKNTPYWLCSCSCGNQIVVDSASLTGGKTKSCGCYQRSITRNRHEAQREMMIGKKFGHLTVLSLYDIKNQARYLCLCDCGSQTIVRSSDLKQNKVISCGCANHETRHNQRIKEWEDFIGTKINKLTAIEFLGVKNNLAVFKFSCECGGETIAKAKYVKSGHIKSCGCLSDKSYGEQKIKKILDESNILYKQQKTFDGLVSDKGVPLRYDFAVINENNEIIRLIEFDGEQHFHVNEHFGGEEGFERRKYLDNLKNQYAISHNIPLTRIPYTEQDNLTLDLLFDDKYTITKQ